MNSEKLKIYYRLTKPGIIYGNLLTTIGAFLYGSILRIDFSSFFGIALGTSLVIASGCVFNNYLDRDIDQHMKRTKRRALVTGAISDRAAITYATVLGTSGFVVLVAFTNTLTAVLGAVGLVSYAVIYTYAKRFTVHSTLIGTISGSIPPVAGYTAATNRLDTSAWILLSILVCWQMVHFYAISIYRRKEYAKAKIPLMSVVHGIWITKLQMVIYGTAFLFAIVSLAKFGYAGLFYLAIMGPLSLWWLLITISGLNALDNEAWARKIFFISLIITLAFSFCLGINAWVP